MSALDRPVNVEAIDGDLGVPRVFFAALDDEQREALADRAVNVLIGNVAGMRGRWYPVVARAIVDAICGPKEDR